VELLHVAYDQAVFELRDVGILWARGTGIRLEKLVEKRIKISNVGVGIIIIIIIINEYD